MPLYHEESMDSVDSAFDEFMFFICPKRYVKTDRLQLTAGLLHGFSLDMGFIYKTKGFLPEEIEMNEHVGIRMGTTFRM